MELFGKQQHEGPGVPLPQLCYDVAYFILPYYAFHNPAKVVELYKDSRAAAGPYFYFMAALRRGVEPDNEAAKHFCWHHEQLEDGRECFLLQYPEPPQIDLTNESFQQIATGATKFVLAPHFSAIIVSEVPDRQYFILGQAPRGGGTTLRCILPDGKNCNLGPGPAPDSKSFLNAITEQISK